MTKKFRKTLLIIASFVCCLATFAFLTTALKPMKNVGAAEINRDPILKYDFSDATLPSGYSPSESLTTATQIASVGTKTDSASLFSGTTSGADSYIKDGKLVIDQLNNSAKTNGRFLLPIKALDGLSQWTISMEVSDMKGYTGHQQQSFMMITTRDLYGNDSDIGKNNPGISIHNTWQNEQVGRVLSLEKSVDASGDNSTWACKFDDNDSFFYDDGIFELVYDGTELTAYINGVKSSSLSIGSSYFDDKEYIQFGGYMLNWGRSSARITLDDICLYDYARTPEQVLRDFDTYENVDFDANGAEFYYDFSKVSASGEVASAVTGASYDTVGKIVSARTVDGKKDVYLEDGKLIINNVLDSNNRDNGYFRLPDNMFAGKTEWTLTMTVSSISPYAWNRAGSLLGFFEKDPSVTPIVEDDIIDKSLRYDADGKALNSSAMIFLYANNDYKRLVPYAQLSDTAKLNGENESFGVPRWAIANDNPVYDKTTVFTFVFKSGYLNMFANGKLIGSTLTHSGGTPTPVSEEYFQKFLFNKIGGYQYSWGRSSLQIAIEDLAFYGRALTKNDRAVENEAYTDAVADLPTTASEVKATLYSRTGATKEATLTVSGVDYATVGIKYYSVKTDGQYSPVSLKLITRDLMPYEGAVSVDKLDTLPEKVTVAYSDGSTGEATATWGAYSYRVGTQTVTGTITDASGRTANATIEVTGNAFKWEKAETLFAQIENEKNSVVLSSFNAFKNALQSKIDALNAFETNLENEEVFNAYEALAEAYENEKANLIAVKPINDAIANYSADEIYAQSTEATRASYEQAKANLTSALENCGSAEERDQLVQAFKTASERLTLTADYMGFSSIDAETRRIYFGKQPETKWGLISASNYFVGDYSFSYTVNEEPEYNSGDDVYLDVNVKTSKNFITYRIWKNIYSANCITRIKNIWSDEANATNVAVNGVFPEEENGGGVWSADQFDFDKPFKVRIERVTEANGRSALYYFYLEQDSEICHAWYDRLEDLTNARIILGASNVSVKLDVAMRGVAVPFATKTDDYYDADGNALAISGDKYAIANGKTVYSSSVISSDSTDGVLVFDLNLSDRNAKLWLSLGQKAGFVTKDLKFTFDATETTVFMPSYGGHVGNFGESSTGTTISLDSLSLGKSYKIAILFSRANPDEIGGKISVKIYVFDGSTKIIESEEEYMYLDLGGIPAITADGGTISVSAITSKNVSGVIPEVIDRELYTTASYQAYIGRVESIDNSIETLIASDQTTIDSIKTQLVEAKSLLVRSMIVELAEELDSINVKQNAKKIGGLPVRVKVRYDNGVTRNVQVTWEKNPDTSKPGTSVVKGTVEQPDGTIFEVEYPIYIKASANTDAGKDNGGLGVGETFILIGVIALAIGAGVVATIIIINKKKNKSESTSDENAENASVDNNDEAGNNE